MNVNYNYLTAIFRSILTQILCISCIIYYFQFDLEKFISKYCKYIFFSTRNLYISLKITSKYCSQIIVVHVNETCFSKVHPACHNYIANGIKPGSNSKNTDQHASDCSKALC